PHPGSSRGRRTVLSLLERRGGCEVERTLGGLRAVAQFTYGRLRILGQASLSRQSRRNGGGFDCEVERQELVRILRYSIGGIKFVRSYDESNEYLCTQL